jgi:hypothetical protein
MAGQSTGSFSTEDGAPILCCDRSSWLASPQGASVPKGCYLQNCVVIEVNYNDLTSAETEWTLRESAGTLFADLSTGSIDTEVGAVPKTTVTAGNVARQVS